MRFPDLIMLPKFQMQNCVCFVDMSKPMSMKSSKNGSNTLEKPDSIADVTDILKEPGAGQLLGSFHVDVTMIPSMRISQKNE